MRKNAMQITRGYRTELDLNHKQITACKKHAGAARYAYNWGLRRKQEVYQMTGRVLSQKKRAVGLSPYKSKKTCLSHQRPQVFDDAD
jgi:hypothetical protein